MQKNSCPRYLEGWEIICESVTEAADQVFHGPVLEGREVTIATRPEGEAKTKSSKWLDGPRAVAHGDEDRPVATRLGLWSLAEREQYTLIRMSTAQSATLWGEPCRSD